MTAQEEEAFKKRIKQTRGIISLNGGFGEFITWCRINQHKGLGNSSITKWIEALPQWPVDQTETKISRLEKAVEDYLVFRINKPARRYNDIEERFLNTQWYVYFYYPEPPHETKAEFGRVVINISSKGEITLQNIHDGVSPGYIGEFRVTRSNLLIFDLTEEERGAHLHIKANINPGVVPSEVLLGAFLSNGRFYISSGTVVFELRENHEKLYPATFSYYDAAKMEEVHLYIRQYLTSKSLNYLRVPDKVFLLDKLADARHGPPAPSSTRFIEVRKPILFISAPTYSVEDEKHYKEIYSKTKRLISNLENRYSDKIDIRFYGFRMEHYNRLEYQNVLGEIRQTSLFCLIYLTKAVSNALIELGMAYGYAKNIRIFARESALPKQGLLRHDSITGSHIILYKFFDEPLEVVFRNIQRNLEISIEQILKIRPVGG